MNAYHGNKCFRMLEGILATLPNKDAESLKSQDFWPIFSRHPKVLSYCLFVVYEVWIQGFSRQSSYKIPE